jgi:hypothetical protein
VFVLLEFSSPSRRIFIGSHSLPPSLVRRIGPSNIYPKMEKWTPRAYICAQPSAAHPSVFEDVEGYKNNFVFLMIPDLSF